MNHNGHRRLLLLGLTVLLVGGLVACSSDGGKETSSTSITLPKVRVPPPPSTTLPKDPDLARINAALITQASVPKPYSPSNPQDPDLGTCGRPSIFKQIPPVYQAVKRFEVATGSFIFERIARFKDEAEAKVVLAGTVPVPDPCRYSLPYAGRTLGAGAQAEIGSFNAPTADSTLVRVELIDQSASASNDFATVRRGRDIVQVVTGVNTLGGNLDVRTYMNKALERVPETGVPAAG